LSFLGERQLRSVPTAFQARQAGNGDEIMKFSVLALALLPMPASGESSPENETQLAVVIEGRGREIHETRFARRANSIVLLLRIV
jgi:hypothetical protein